LDITAAVQQQTDGKISLYLDDIPEINNNFIISREGTDAVKRPVLLLYVAPPSGAHNITVVAPPGGSITPNGDVSVPDGGSTNFVITPDTHYFISSVLTNGAGVTVADPAGFTYTWSSITADGTLEATFDRIKTNTREVPTAWLASQDANWSTNYEAAAMADPDGDGFATWQEYWCGTDPLNAESYFKINAIEFNGSQITIKWEHAKVDANIPPITILGCTDISGGSWSSLGTHAPANGTNTWSAPANAPQFYRIGVTNVP
jgi:hypothetical protein